MSTWSRLRLEEEGIDSVAALAIADASSLAGVISAFFHRASSALFVPESSPREIKGAAAAAIFFRAAIAEVVPLMPAGSAAGPTMMKSLCITSRRSAPKPPSM